VPLPDVDGAIAEAAYAFDTLKCDGIGVMDSVALRFLGDPHSKSSCRNSIGAAASVIRG